MAVMEAYFDESGTHDGSPFVCVAGYLFQKGTATALDAAWRWMLEENGLPFFRMSDCAHGTGPFKGWSKIDRTNLEIRAIDLVKTYAAYGFAASVVMEDFHLIPNLGLFDTAYSFAACKCFLASNFGPATMTLMGMLHMYLRAANNISQKLRHSWIRFLSILR